MNHYLQKLKDGILISNHYLASINSAVILVPRNKRMPFTMFEIIPLLCILIAIALLIVLSIIDLKILILPDELNLALGIAGLAFHLCSGWLFFGWQGMLLGALLGGGMLYVIRFFANRAYGRDTLGLGDVKLMAAAGIWLGPEMILIAITLGALAGLVHGLIYAAWHAAKTKTKFTIHELSIPAGPGFAIGSVIAGAYLFTPYVQETLHDLFS